MDNHGHGTEVYSGTRGAVSSYYDLMCTEDAWGVQSKTCWGSIGCNRTEHWVRPPSFLPSPWHWVLAHLLQPVLPLLSTEGFFALSLLSVEHNQLYFTWRDHHRTTLQHVQNAQASIHLIFALCDHSDFLHLVQSSCQVFKESFQNHLVLTSRELNSRGGSHFPGSTFLWLLTILMKPVLFNLRAVYCFCNMFLL